MVETTTNNRKLLRPSEIKKSNVMVENIIEVLENTFLSQFHDELDAAMLPNIVSGQTVDDSIKESLLSLGEAGKQLISEYIEIMSTEINSESTVMNKIRQYKMKNLTASTLSFKVKQNEKNTETRDIYLVNLFNLLIETIRYRKSFEISSSTCLFGCW